MENGKISKSTKYCIVHPSEAAVDTCSSCKKPICKKCQSNYQIYSVAEEAGLPYCKACYDKSVGFVNKFGRN